MGFWDLLQNLFLVLAIATGIGAGVAAVGMHVHFGQQREAVYDALDLLAKEIQIEAQLAIPTQVGAFPNGEVTYPDTQHIRAAQGFLGTAAREWSEEDYDEAVANVEDGYRALGRTPPDLNFEYVQSFSPAGPVFGLQVPEQTIRYGWAALLFGVLVAICAAIPESWGPWLVWTKQR